MKNKFRIEQIAKMVDKCNVVADIGTDHGYVAEILLEEKKCLKIIATDLNEGPLKSARMYLSRLEFGKQIDFRLGDGLKILKPREADTIIIAGMGGLLINKILDTSPDVVETVKEFVLQPMTAVDKVREYLHLNDYKIVSESLVKEYHHYYFILKVIKEKQDYDDKIYYEISKYLLEKKDKLIGEYIDKKIETNKKIIQNIEDSKKYTLVEKKEKLKQKIQKFMELKRKYEIK